MDEQIKTDGLALEVRCNKCAEGLHHFTIGMVGGEHGSRGIPCCKCGAPGLYVLPFVPECPGTGATLTRRDDGSLHWDGGTSLTGAPGDKGSPGPPTPEDEARRKRIIEITGEQRYVREGEVEIDDAESAKLSEGDDNGCYVSGWIWCPFAGTEFDKEKE